jgi:hypothetical protein
MLMREECIEGTDVTTGLSNTEDYNNPNSVRCGSNRGKVEKAIHEIKKKKNHSLSSFALKWNIE